MHNPQDANVALTGAFVSAGAAIVAYLPVVETFLRIGASVVAIATGIASLVYFGRQNRWWR